MRKGSATSVPQGVRERLDACIDRCWTRFGLVSACAHVSLHSRTETFVIAKLVKHAHSIGMDGGCFSLRTGHVQGRREEGV